MDITEFQKTIIDYYHEFGRKFPWRETTDPYHILVSELMLQQTQTERVIPKYEKWLERFPTMQSLAEAPLQEVLLYWNGLGYNRRARFLQQVCSCIIQEYDGIFPETPEELVKLPGIGPYTAGAVSCFTGNRAEVFIETNIRAVFIFFFFSEIFHDSSEKTVSDAQILPLVKDSLPEPSVISPREWYYALMDYGAMLKRKTVNPNRKSRSYSRQTKFEGSVRQARGVILRQLVNNTDENGLTLSQIQKAEYIEIDRLKTAADLLCAEKLITQDGDLYRIV